MTAPYYSDDSVTLYHGDCLDVMATLADASVDAVCTDPPYGLEFMGKDWDKFSDGAGARAGISDVEFKNLGPLPNFLGGGQATCANCGGDKYRGDESGKRRRCRCDSPSFPNVGRIRGSSFQQWCEQWTAQCLRVLKPGGYLLAFGGSRTWHRLACAVEDAGFEVRDSIAWLYGSGFPKSLDVSKAIDKAAGADREAGPPNPWAGRRSVSLPGAGGTVAVEGGAYGATPHTLTTPATPAAQQWEGWGTALKPAFEPIVVGRKPLVGTVAANVLAHGTGALNIDACRVDANGERFGGGAKGSSGFVDGYESGAGFRRGSDKFRDAYGDFEGQEECVAHRGADSGGASRFFATFRYEAKAPTAERPRHGDVAHPTVKPLDLMRWLVRLVTPPGGTVLEPFAGSGTTAEACVIEGFRCIAIEREAAYLPLITARLSKPIQPDLFGGAA